jgi:flavin-dependent dehydrogenase
LKPNAPIDYPITRFPDYSMVDVLIVGAGPAGSVAGIVLARAGARVRLVDRVDFPRDKLCGDTVNPGTLARLRSLGIGAAIEAHGLRVDGMLVTGEGGAAIEGTYPNGLTGRAILRRDLDWLLLEAAVKAGCQFDPHVAVREAIVERARVTGARAGANGSTRDLRARVTLAADGRRSTIAFGLGLARHPDQPRRWAIGAYFEGVQLGFTAAIADNAEDRKGSLRSQRSPRFARAYGEMHVRRGRYIGVAPLPGGATNVCLVKPSHAADGDLRDPAALLTDELARDPLLRDRFAGAELVTTPVVLGPLAVDVRSAAIDGLLLAGDAAGFIDPITGDGLRFAVRGGELAAAAALDALTHGWKGVHTRLAERRRREFGAKWRFNRALRALVGSPRGVSAAAAAAPFAPAMVRVIISRAGDCGTVPLG